jgi:hypothetical protein
MSGRLQRSTWLAAALGASWLSGALLQTIPDGILRQMRDQPQDWLLPIAAAVVLLGYLLSRVSLAFGPASIRTLLRPDQARWIAGLLTSLVCVTWTGVIWSNLSGNTIGQVFWQLFAGAAVDLFVLGWLCLALRAAVSLTPAKVGVALLLGGVMSLVASYAGLVALALAFSRFGWELNLPIVGLLVVLLTGIFLLPPMMLVSGMAAVFAGISGAKDDNSSSKL